MPKINPQSFSCLVLQFNPSFNFESRVQGGGGLEGKVRSDCTEMVIEPGTLTFSYVTRFSS